MLPCQLLKQAAFHNVVGIVVSVTIWRHSKKLFGITSHLAIGEPAMLYLPCSFGL
jgi:hypothetical protein